MGALINDYTELQLHFCLNNNYTFFRILRVLISNYTNWNHVEKVCTLVSLYHVYFKFVYSVMAPQ